MSWIIQDFYFWEMIVIKHLSFRFLNFLHVEFTLAVISNIKFSKIFNISCEIVLDWMPASPSGVIMPKSTLTNVCDV